MLTKPLIGITTQRWSSSLAEADTRVQGQLDGYLEATLATGGLPVLIPLSLAEDDLNELYSRLDGLVIPGGGDMDPTAYQAAPHPTTNAMDPERDRVELFLSRRAVADHKPILGICRGIQVLNVAQGGTLYQDLPSEYADALPHYFRPPDFPLDHEAHTIKVEEESLLATCLAAPLVAVNSRHHQAVRQVAPGWEVVARAPDGVIEAVELPRHPFALGVQWHPENLQQRPEMRGLFERLVEAARRPRRDP